MTLEAAVASKIWIVAVWFAFIFILERARPKAAPPTARKRLVSNGALWLVVLLISPTIVLPLTVFASGHALWVRDGAFAAPVMILVDIVLLDCWTYWLHRAYHRIPLMWRFHAAHHLDEHLDSTSSLRFHAFEVALSALLRMLPIVLLAIPFAHVVVFETALLACAVFHHSNVRLPASIERGLSFVIVTPSIHWVHHHAKWGDTNSNYSGVFSWWDRLFGTKSRTIRTPEMAIGVEGFSDRPFLALLATPFTGAG
ncbi:MAG TPA: sterol desaturase family protein, partial [Parvularculaceae bacterium]|nr:sterol desaturase family protein [Parvularculaceae bacterium]